MLDGNRSGRSAKTRILVVDDDGPEREGMCLALEAAGFRADCVVSAEEGRRHVGRFGSPDLLLLAVRARSHTVEVALCRDIHASGDVPLIALTSEALYSEATLMEACFDDFIIRPAEPGEIVMRVRRCLRRWSAPGEGGEDATARRSDGQAVAIGSHTVRLTDREADLLRLLMRYPDRALGREYLLQQVWPDEPVNDGTLRVTVHRLRRKLEQALGDRVSILSVRGRGYLFAPHAPAAVAAGATPERAVA
jgi:DNA-binding response OmpR family regulator